MDNTHETPTDSRIAKEEQEIQKIGKRIRSILEFSGLDRNKIKQDIKRFLTEASIPFTRVDIEEDRNRTDGRQLCSARIYVPSTWPTDIGRNDEYFITFSVREYYEPEGHL